MFRSASNDVSPVTDKLLLSTVGPDIFVNPDIVVFPDIFKLNPNDVSPVTDKLSLCGSV